VNDCARIHETMESIRRHDGRNMSTRLTLALFLTLYVFFVRSDHALTRAYLLPTAAEKQDHRSGSPAGAPNSLNRINSRADFDSLARVYFYGRFKAVPHVMFVVDRRSRNRVYYVNSRVYPFHKDFINATYLSLERGRVFYENNYLKSDRRFILGTIAYQTSVDKFAFEFWEGDQITQTLLTETMNVLKESFYAPLCFKPNSLAQE